MHGQADIAGIGQRRSATVQADPHTHLRSLRPRAVPQAALDAERGCQSSRRVLEDRKELIGVGIHLEPAA